MGWASTPRLLASQARCFCCALLQISHPSAARMTAIQGRLGVAPVRARVATVVRGVGLGSGVGAGGGGVGSVVGVGTGSGVGAGGVGGTHCSTEGLHSIQPFPVHSNEGVVAWDVPPKRRAVPMNPRRIAPKTILRGVRFLGLVMIFPFREWC